VWVGIRKGAEEIRDIFKQIEPRLRGLGFPPDSKGFSPHITIARVRSNRNIAGLSSLLNKLSDESFGTIEVNAVRLKRSVLMPRGPIYSTLREVTANKP